MNKTIFQTLGIFAFSVVILGFNSVQCEEALFNNESSAEANLARTRAAEVVGIEIADSLSHQGGTNGSHPQPPASGSNLHLGQHERIAKLTSEVGYKGSQQKARGTTQNALVGALRFKDRCRRQYLAYPNCCHGN